MNIEEIEGIGPQFAEQLRGAGVRTTEALLERGGTRKGRQELADASGLTGAEAVADGLVEGVQIRAVDEPEFDAVLGQGVLEQVVGAAVERGARHDVVAGAGEVEDREGLGRLAGRHAQCRHATLESGDALLEDIRGRVHDPGVDVAEFLKPEEAGGMIGVVEDVARGGVDRDCPGLRRGIDGLAGVDGEGFVLSGGSGLVGHEWFLLRIWPPVGGGTRT